MTAFVEPPWDQPLDAEAVVRSIPASETVKGMFLQPMLVAAKTKGIVLPGARERYVGFQDYPLREHAGLLVAFAGAAYPDLSLRQGLRRIGRQAQRALVESTIGRVMWASADDVTSALGVMVKAYAVAHPTCDVALLETTPRSVRIKMHRIWWFLDSHHIGCLEGAMKAAGVTGSVKIRTSSPSSGEMECSWLAPRVSPPSSATDRPRITAVRTATLTICALIAFAANSLLCRRALGTGAIDAASFTSVRLLSGALVLAVLARLGREPLRGAGSWRSASALFVYAFAFSTAYLRLGAGVGALILFGAVQATMIGAAIVAGERPNAREWVGIALALAGLLALTLPGVSAAAPDAAGALTMALAGVAWGVYTLRGRGGGRPLAITADNFLRCVPLALIASTLSLGLGASFHASARGVWLAALSGTLASAVGYTIWYAALRGLTSTLSAIVQLSVPVLAAVGGLVLLGETATLRFAVAASAILGGVALVVLARRRG